MPRKVIAGLIKTMPAYTPMDHIAAMMSAAPSPCFGCTPDSWDRLKIADGFQGNGRNRSAAVTYVDCAEQAVWHLPEMTPSFEPSTFGDAPDATRLTVTFRVASLEHQLLFEQLDEWVVDYCARPENCERIFGCKYTREEIQAKYVSPLKRNDKYGASLRCKYHTAGAFKTRFWGQDRQPREAPQAWRSCELKARVRMGPLWFVGRDFGVSLSLYDVQVSERTPDLEECPF